MQFPVDGQGVGGLASHHLEPAVHVSGVDAGDRAGHPVVHPGGRTLHQPVCPIGRPAAGHHVQAVVDRRQQLGQFGRIVLAVGVHQHDYLTTRPSQPGVESRRLSQVGAQAHLAQPRHFGFQAVEHGPSGVGGTVIDDHYFPGQPEAVEHVAQFAEHDGEVHRFVVGRHHDGDGQRVHAGQH